MSSLKQIQQILYSFANNKITKSDKEFYIISDLLNNHPNAVQKIGCGINYFFVQPSKYKWGQYNFMIVRVDGTSTDFSFMKCLYPKQKSSQEPNWSGIFRNIVKSQTTLFKIKAFEKVGIKDKFICSQTNLKFKKIYAHVDHVFPLTFDSILQEYLHTYNVDLKNIKLSEDKGTSDVREVMNEHIVKTFYEFHKKRAVLRIVCSTANLQGKKTKNYDGENPQIIKEELIKKYPQYHL